MTNPILTADADEFRTHLWPGDILVFDSVGLDAGLVQWGDDIPANHVSVVIDDTTIFEANRKHDDDDDIEAVRSVPLMKRLGKTQINTTTALRHTTVKAQGDPRITQILKWTTDREGAGSFAYLGTAALGPLAFQRSFKDKLPGTPAVEALLKALLWAAAESAAPLVKKNGCALSCSEFIFRCYDEGSSGSLTLTVDNPLSDGHWPGLFAAEEDALRKALGTPRSNCTFYGPRSSIADWVTPGDFLRSRSLRSVAALHRPDHIPTRTLAPEADDIATI